MMELLTTTAAIGGLIAFVLFVIVMPYCLADDGDGMGNPFAAMAWLVIGAVVLFFTQGGFPQLSLIAWLILIPAYFAVGFLWFLWKWRQLILAKKSEATRRIMARTANDWPGMSEASIRALFRPEASRYKEQITGWIVLWPWGVAWTVLKWPWRLAERITVWARGIADRMVDRLWNIA